MRTVTLQGVLIFLVVAASVAANDLRESVRQDWALQDRVFRQGELQVDVVQRVVDSLGGGSADLRGELQRLRSERVPGNDRRWLEVYHRACGRRRAARLRPYRDQLRRVVFTKHFDLGGSHYAYTEAQSDAQHERNFQPGSALCLLRMDGAYGQVETLIADEHGVIRDPDVSFDGQRILFAWKQSDRGDDYHLYEMDWPGRRVRQLTSGLGVADYEGTYLPNGGILFNSTRCVQTVDCWWTEVSNLYACDADGKRIRRLTFDQVHTNFPTVCADGRVIYTRWEYSDRGQIFVQSLFQMNPDGTGQTECYGNNSWFPTAILHARSVPETRQIVAILSGHHTHQRGQLAILDPDRGRQEAAGVELIAPERPAEPVRIDQFGQDGPQFQYPYPLDRNAFLVAMDPIGSPNRQYERPYAIYLVERSGARELLACDPAISCNQPVPLRPRPTPPERANVAVDGQEDGVYYVQDVHAGPGLAGVPRGTIRKLRVVAIRFRAAGIRRNYNEGPAGAALASTPVAIGNGAWDVKEVVGEATVHEDGSACFRVPARTPVYFQALDAAGHAVQTMRSWSTLQPGETFSCVGCHEPKNRAPATRPLTLALRQPPELWEVDATRAAGFSFPRHVQPILDRHCTNCHDDRTQQIAWDEPCGPVSDRPVRAFSLLSATTTENESGRRWSDAYLALTRAAQHSARWKTLQGKPNRLVSWITAQSEPTMLPPYRAGAARSGLMRLLEEGHAGVRLSRQELRTIACWIDLSVPYCGDYTEANAWTAAERERYQHFLDKRRRWNGPTSAAANTVDSGSNSPGGR